MLLVMYGYCKQRSFYCRSCILLIIYFAGHVCAKSGRWAACVRHPQHDTQRLCQQLCKALDEYRIKICHIAHYVETLRKSHFCSVAFLIKHTNDRQCGCVCSCEFLRCSVCEMLPRCPIQSIQKPNFCRWSTWHRARVVLYSPRRPGL
jgi:hypothetical protein